MRTRSEAARAKAATPEVSADDFMAGGAPEARELHRDQPLPQSYPVPMDEGPKAIAHVRLPGDFERIVETVFNIGDARALYDRLMACLEVGGEGLNDRGSLRSALDKAERHAQEAHKLFASACRERKRLKHRAEIVLSGLRDGALAELHHEKQAGERSKQITDADVTARIAAKYPDEWSVTEDRLAAAAIMEDNLKELLDSWRSKCASLRVLLETCR